MSAAKEIAHVFRWHRAFAKLKMPIKEVEPLSLGPLSRRVDHGEAAGFKDQSLKRCLWLGFGLCQLPWLGSRGLGFRWSPVG